MIMIVVTMVVVMPPLVIGVVIAVRTTANRLQLIIRELVGVQWLVHVDLLYVDDDRSIAAATAELEFAEFASVRGANPRVPASLPPTRRIVHPDLRRSSRDGNAIVRTLPRPIADGLVLRGAITQQTFCLRHSRPRDVEAIGNDVSK